MRQRVCGRVRGPHGGERLNLSASLYIEGIRPFLTQRRSISRAGCRPAHPERAAASAGRRWPRTTITTE